MLLTLGEEGALDEHDLGGATGVLVNPKLMVYVSGSRHVPSSFFLESAGSQYKITCNAYTKRAIR